mmetsp:Transcript_33766/g.67215  ORF Transcript_33766/g.67215 Transcript_33766/m.67215 type:complete len:623 (+) Transcript_33766:485-2353(+)
MACVPKECSQYSDPGRARSRVFNRTHGIRSILFIWLHRRMGYKHCNAYRLHSQCHRPCGGGRRPPHAGRAGQAEPPHRGRVPAQRRHRVCGVRHLPGVRGRGRHEPVHHLHHLPPALSGRAPVGPGHGHGGRVRAAAAGGARRPFDGDFAAGLRRVHDLLPRGAPPPRVGRARRCGLRGVPRERARDRGGTQHGEAEPRVLGDDRLPRQQLHLRAVGAHHQRQGPQHGLLPLRGRDLEPVRHVRGAARGPRAHDLRHAGGGAQAPGLRGQHERGARDGVLGAARGRGPGTGHGGGARPPHRARSAADHHGAGGRDRGLDAAHQRHHGGAVLRVPEPVPGGALPRVADRAGAHPARHRGPRQHEPPLGGGFGEEHRQWRHRGVERPKRVPQEAEEQRRHAGGHRRVSFPRVRRLAHGPQHFAGRGAGHSLGPRAGAGPQPPGRGQRHGDPHPRVAGSVLLRLGARRHLLKRKARHALEEQGHENDSRQPNTVGHGQHRCTREENERRAREAPQVERKGAAFRGGGPRGPQPAREPAERMVQAANQRSAGPLPAANGVLEKSQRAAGGRRAGSEKTARRCCCRCEGGGGCEAPGRQPFAGPRGQPNASCASGRGSEHARRGLLL